MRVGASVLEEELTASQERPEHVLGGLASGGAGFGTVLCGGLVEGSEVSGVFGAVWRAG